MREVKTVTERCVFVFARWSNVHICAYVCYLLSRMRKRMMAAVSLGCSGIKGSKATITWLSRGPRCAGSTLLTKQSHVLPRGKGSVYKKKKNRIRNRCLSKCQRIIKINASQYVTLCASIQVLTGSRGEGSPLCIAGRCVMSSSSSLWQSWCVWSPSVASEPSHLSKPARRTGRHVHFEPRRSLLDN